MSDRKDEMRRITDNLARRGLEPMSMERLFALAPGLFHTAQTHTIVMIGGEAPYHSVICDSTGGAFRVPCSLSGAVAERVVCGFCGMELHSGVKRPGVIAGKARAVPTWEVCDAWPALEAA